MEKKEGGSYLGGGTKLLKKKSHEKGSERRNSKAIRNQRKSLGRSHQLKHDEGKENPKVTAEGILTSPSNQRSKNLVR